MVLKEINKRILTFILLGLFLISTSGIVLFNHFCQHSHQMIYSFFVDDTEQMCAENANLYCSPHTHHHDCCSSNSTHDDDKSEQCCQHHKSQLTTVKINTSFTYSKQLNSPKPFKLSLLFEPHHRTTVLYKLNNKLTNYTLHDYPPEHPTFFLSGKDIVTFQHSLKLDC